MGGLLDAIVTVGAGEEDEFAVFRCVAVFFCIGKERVSGHDYGCGVRDRAALDRDTASVGTVEAEEIRESACSVFLD